MFFCESYSHAPPLLLTSSLGSTTTSDDGRAIEDYNSVISSSSFRMDDCEVFECGVASLGRRAVDFVRGVERGEQENAPQIIT